MDQCLWNNKSKVGRRHRAAVQRLRSEIFIQPRMEHLQADRHFCMRSAELVKFLSNVTLTLPGNEKNQRDGHSCMIC